jgi:hypothetical protein
MQIQVSRFETKSIIHFAKDEKKISSKYMIQNDKWMLLNEVPHQE